MVEGSKSVNDFTFDLLKNCNPGNVVVSGVSAYMALAAAIYGARGQTFRNLCGLIPVTEHETRDQIRSVWHMLNRDKETLVTAKKILVCNNTQRTSEENDAYVASVKNVFDVDVQKCDFTHSAKRVASFLNEWVSKLTRGKISGAIDDVSPDTVLMIINVMYFAGKWYRELRIVSLEEHQYFANHGSSLQKVTMLYVNNVYTEYYVATMANNEKVEGVLLYFKNCNNKASESCRVTFEIIVPRNAKYLCEYENFDIRHYFANRIAKETFVDVRMPKFKLEHVCPLKNLLEKMGFGDAFVDDADFSAITGIRGGISTAIQKTVIEVNEKGVEAATVTTLVCDKSTPNVEIVADKPFIFLIRDVQSDIILFVGRVTAL